MASLASKKAQTTKRVLVYGPPKVGKSLLAGKLSRKFKLIWFDLENGHDVLFQLASELQENIELISIPDSRVNPMAAETMLKVIRGKPVRICEKHGKVACPLCAKDNSPYTDVCLDNLDESYCLVVDSLTQLTNSFISNITRNQPDDYKLQFDDWGNLGKLMDMFLSQIQAARYNVVCLTHEQSVKMQDESEKIVPTAGTANFSRNTAKYFSDVVYCEIKNKKHVFASTTTYANKIVAGSRSGISLEASATPDLADLWG